MQILPDYISKFLARLYIIYAYRKVDLDTCKTVTLISFCRCAQRDLYGVITDIKKFLDFVENVQEDRIQPVIVSA